ncbi:prostaglandin E synthase 2-like [Plectropomus leopardus]|uniref:prostaglandin E synthase 2-like n=1 Tax=Plectropomus leopardus TaxID=160734 RepID=UPI001C4CF3A0|nr:prostaglandin E synthase 2-like [Plectropomus leopardus]
MAAACSRALCKVGWTILESPVTRRPATLSYLVGNVSARGSRRAFSTGGTGSRSKLLSSLRQGGGSRRVLGCAVLLGSGLGLYQTVRFRIQQHLAEEDTKVSPLTGASERPQCRLESR